MTRSHTRGDDGTATPRKSTLFCPGCDHQSPADGDWVLSARDEAVALGCPVCGTTLTERPRREATRAPSKFVRHAFDLWRATVSIGFSSVRVVYGTPFVYPGFRPNGR